MSINQSDLDSFHDFASRIIARQADDRSLEDLIQLWRYEQEQKETIESIRRGVADAAAGRMCDLDEADARNRQELGFPPRHR